MLLNYKSEKRNIIETNRLSFVIRTIDKDFTVLPVGKWINYEEMMYFKDLIR